MVETPIGQTLCITDRLGGNLAWSRHQFEFANNASGKMALELFANLESIRHSSPKNSIYRFINVNARNVDLNIEEKTDWLKTTWDINVVHVGMRITGGFGIRGDGGKKIDGYINDLKYGHNQICATLTENFDKIAKLIPVYERLRQFIGMIYALNELKQKGFKLNSDLQTHVDRKRIEFEGRIIGKPPEYVSSFPLLVKSGPGC